MNCLRGIRKLWTNGFRRQLLVLGSVSLYAYSLEAQDYSYVQYDVKDGLPSSTVYDITQDKDGFVWLATENGLCRFDGAHFTNFFTKNGLPDNAILKVHADNTGRVYFSPFTHTPYYYYKDSIYKLDIPAKYKLDLSGVVLLLNKGNKTIFVANDSYILEEGNTVIRLHDLDNRIPENCFARIATDSLIGVIKNDSVYFFSDNGAVRIRPIDRKMKFYIINSEGEQVSIQGKKNSQPIAGSLSNDVFFASWDEDVFFYNNITGELLYKIEMEKFSDALIDNENNLWITTLGNGVFRFPSLGFKHYSFSGRDEIFSLAQSPDGVIAGSDFSKAFLLTHTSDSAFYHPFDYTHFIAGSGNPISHSSKRNRIFKLLRDKEAFYVGTDAFLLKERGNSRSIFKNIFPVKDLELDGDRLLVCLSTGVLLLNSTDMSVRDTLLRQRATAGIILGKDYYIGTLGGLIKVDAKTKAITELSRLYPSLRGRITAIKKGWQNDLWVATSGSGLVHVKNDKVVGIINEQTGLTSDICTSLFIHENEIWLGTNKGLNRIVFDERKGTAIMRLTTANGLPTDFINAVLVHNDTVYVGSSTGVTIFPKEIRNEKSICVLHILGISEENNQLKNDSSFTFPHSALNIKVDFTAISFKSAGDIKYHYQLQGLDEDWNITENNFVNFPTLPPGQYELKIKATNKFGVESNMRSIAITILPPWWKTWWFISLVLLVLAAVIVLIFRRNIRSVRNKEKNRRAIEARFAALEQQALQAQMNPHFIFNCLNSIQSFILDLDVEGANNYLSSFASLIRQTLDNSNQPFITLAAEIKYLRTYLYLEKLRFRDKFNFSIHVDEEIEPEHCILPGMLLQPYVENALRHGIQHRDDKNGFISLTIKKDSGGGIVYTIKDNGPGRKKAASLKSGKHIEYQSRGTTISEKRIQAINNQYKTNIQVTIEDSLDAVGEVDGTIVTFIIPEFSNFSHDILDHRR